MTVPSAEQWDRIKDLFDRALALDPAERAVFLEREARDDAERREVEALLQSLDSDPDFLESTPAAHAAALLAEGSDPLLGQPIGAYRILRELARGGMGKVYLGERCDTYRKAVAIKVVKRGMDTDEVVRRFGYERQVLATLDHPNIARILDGGALADGRPYLVMDYIEGEPIARYANTRELSIEECLTLFLKICDAVAYAHRNLVIHRDLKPGNIVVRPDGSPVLLDFGIAKVLDERLAGGTIANTAAGLGPMTPEYASPEQLLGRTVTTASDIYSLGVILFELLTRTRFAHVDTLTPEAIQRLATAEPIAPSAAAEKRRGRALRGDLDTIVLHAVEKDPARRYVSVEQLAEDIRRHQRGLPLAARPSGWTVRAGKFVRRHRAGVAVAALLLIALTTAAAVTWRQKQNADRQRAFAAKVANTMVFEVADAMSRMSGPTEQRLKILVQAQQIFDALRSDGSNREVETRSAEANRSLAQTYRLLGDLPRAHERIRAADGLLQRYAEAPDAATDELSSYGSVQIELGDVLSAMKKSAEGTAAYARGKRFLELANARPDAKPMVRSSYALSLTRLGDRYYTEGRYAEAEPLFHRAYAEMQEATARAPGNPIHWSRYAMSLERVADCLYYSGRTEEACTRYAEALRIREQSVARNPGATDLQAGLGIANQNCGYCAEEQGRIDEAIALYRKGIDIQRELVRADPSNTITLGNLMAGQAQLASTYQRAGDFPSAVALLDESARVSRGFRSRYAATPTVLIASANNAQVLGDTLMKMGREAEAEKALQSALADFESLRKSDPASVDRARDLAFVELSFVRLMQRRGDRSGALAHARRAVEMSRLVASSGLPADAQELAHALYELGAELRSHGDRAGAATAADEGRTLLHDLLAKQQMAPTSEGARVYLPALEKLFSETR